MILLNYCHLQDFSLNQRNQKLLVVKLVNQLVAVVDEAAVVAGKNIKNSFDQMIIFF